MKHIPLFFFCCLSFIYDCNAYSPNDSVRKISIQKFSERLNQETGATLQHVTTSTYRSQKRLMNTSKEPISLSYSLNLQGNDEMTIDKARHLLVSICESLVKELNSNENVKKDRSLYPLNPDWVDLQIEFKHNKEPKKNEVSHCSLLGSKVRFQMNSNTTMESYEEAHKTALSQGALENF